MAARVLGLIEEDVLAAYFGGRLMLREIADNLVGHREDLIAVLIEREMVIAEMRTAHVPMEGANKSSAPFTP